MRTVRKTVKWVFLLLLGGAAGVGGYGAYLWNQSDDLLRQTLLDRLHELAPGWEINLPRARFDLLGRIHVYDLSLKAGDMHLALLHVPEAVLTVDREHLADPETPIRHVRWIRPKLHLERDPDGVWNIQKLPALKLPRNVIPEFHVERMLLAVTVHDLQSDAGTTTNFEDINLQLIPSGARQFLVKAVAKFSHSDGISAAGSWQLDAGTFDLKGQVRNLTIDGSLSQLAAEFSPEYRAARARLEALLESLPTAAEAPADGGSTPADPVARMGLSAVGDVQFRVTQWRPGAEREFKVSVNILRGELNHPPFPFPLRDLQGKIDLENQQILLHDVSAHSGATRITLEQGRVLERGALRPADFDLDITSLPLDDRVPTLLPPALKRVYADVQPTGEVDLHVHLEYNGHDRWDHDCDLVARNGTVAHKKFPYRVDQVEGTITQRGDIVDVDMQGHAGTQVVKLVGRVKNPGDEAASEFVVKTAGIPIDERLRANCPPKFRKVIDQLRAQGELDGTVRFQRVAGLNQPLVISVDARFQNGTVNCLPFAYPLSGVSGEFRGSGDNWEFENFVGRHGPAEVSCQGVFHPNRQGRLELDLEFSLMGATFDRQLLAALPEDMQNAWREFNPGGGLNIPHGRILWSPEAGGRFHVASLEAQVFDAKLKLRSFPFAITDVAAEINFDGKQANIKSFSGRHDDAIFRVDGGFARFDSDGEWSVHLEPMYVDDLETTREFRKALPDQMLRIVEALNPRGKQSISGMLEFRGKCGGGYPVTAAWQTVTVYSGTTINAGVELRDIHGKAWFRGTWDGETAVGDGRIDLDSLKLFDYQLRNIKGPASIDGTRLVLGSTTVEGRPGAQEADPARRISARFIEGLLALDAIVDLGEPMRYHVRMTLADGELKRYAQLYMPGNNKLAGRMNGSIDLEGEGVNPKRLTGTGKLVISPAALYDLPVLVKVINALQLIPPDNKAFDQALFVFDIKDSMVHFGRIDLVGDSIKLVGQGTVNFDTKVNLRFASRMGRKQLPIPVFREVVNELSKGMVGVNVTGTLKEPHTVVRSFQQLDDALRRLFDARSSHQPRR